MCNCSSTQYGLRVIRCSPECLECLGLISDKRKVLCFEQVNLNEFTLVHDLWTFWTVVIQDTDLRVGKDKTTDLLSVPAIPQETGVFFCYWIRKIDIVHGSLMLVLCECDMVLKNFISLIPQQLNNSWCFYRLWINLLARNRWKLLLLAKIHKVVLMFSL